MDDRTAVLVGFGTLRGRELRRRVHKEHRLHWIVSVGDNDARKYRKRGGGQVGQGMAYSGWRLDRVEDGDGSVVWSEVDS